MRAVVQREYGSPDLLRLVDVESPVVGDDEVLVRVRATSLHPDVWHTVTGRPYVLRLLGAGLRRPKDPVPGTDLAGTVESVGAAVTRFRPGDEVFGESIRGQQWRNGGAFAELASAPAAGLAAKPTNLSFVEAAAVPTSGLIALNNLHQVGLRPGQRVLVNGAAGGVGAVAVQVAKARGAEVTAVDGPNRLDLMRSLDADRVLDHTREDYTRTGDRYDLIFDVPGNHPFAECRRALAPDGTYVLIGHDHYGRAGGAWWGSLPRFAKLIAMSLFVQQLPRPAFSLPSKQDSLTVLAGLLETGSLTPVVDRTYPLEEVHAAMRYLASGEARGKVVLTV